METFTINVIHGDGGGLDDETLSNAGRLSAVVNALRREYLENERGTEFRQRKPFFSAAA